MSYVIDKRPVDLTTTATTTIITRGTTTAVAFLLIWQNQHKRLPAVVCVCASVRLRECVCHVLQATYITIMLLPVRDRTNGLC